jgi:hypothetical protein
MDKKQQAIKKIDELLKNLHKTKYIQTSEIKEFYAKIEENYDDAIEEIEMLLEEEIEDEHKFQKLKRISELLEVNIF